MLLPQSSAFAALKNRLNSVSAIGYLHIPSSSSQYYPSSSNITAAPPPGTIGSQATALRSTYVSSAVSNIHSRQKSADSNAPAAKASSDASGQLQPREPPAIRWVELLEKFRNVQERARKGQRVFLHDNDQEDFADDGAGPGPEIRNGSSANGTANMKGGRGANQNESRLGLVEEHPSGSQQLRGAATQGNAAGNSRTAPSGGRITPSQQQSQANLNQQGKSRTNKESSGGLSGRLERFAGGVAARRTKR